jgi:Carboxylesterase family
MTRDAKQAAMKLRMATLQIDAPRTRIAPTGLGGELRLPPRDPAHAWDHVWLWILGHGRGVGPRRLDSRGTALAHGAEICRRSVFGNFPKPASAGDEAVSALMRQYWINFAAHGDPNGPGLPIWKAFDEDSQMAMVFGDSSASRRLPNIDGLEALDKLVGCGVS